MAGWLAVSIRYAIIKGPVRQVSATMINPTVFILWEIFLVSRETDDG